MTRTNETNEKSEEFYALEYRPKDKCCMVAVFITPEERDLWLSDSDLKPGFIREAIASDILEKLHQKSAKAPINKKLFDIVSARYAPTGGKVH